ALAEPAPDGGRPPARSGCDTCRGLRSGPGPRLAAVVGALEQPVLRLQESAGPAGFARRYGSPRHAGLVLLGSPPCAG
ncbi:hypothetical protein GTW78_12725, partial [Streptomyces sp. SID4948]|nr:hypothetical protein [Streptomyces sp. SID4948]